jgi:hypothetical protein
LPFVVERTATSVNYAVFMPYITLSPVSSSGEVLFAAKARLGQVASLGWNKHAKHFSSSLSRRREI